MFKGRIGRVMLAIAFSGLGVLGMSSPASADEEEVSFREYCGYVEITIPGNEGFVSVYRNGDHIGVTDQEVSYWGAAPDDFLEVEGTDETWTYQNPEECQIPDIKFEFETGCQELIKLTVNNAGPGAMTGFIFEGGDLPPGSSFDLDSLSFPVGITELVIAVDEEYFLYQQESGIDFVWYMGYYEEPEECDPNNVDVTFTDLCGKVKIHAEGLERLQGLVVFKNDELLELVFLTDGSVTKEYDAVAGDEFKVFYPNPEEDIDPVLSLTAQTTTETPEKDDDLVLIGEHTHVAQECELPVTGAKTGTMVLAGLLLLVLGAGLVLSSRLRWIAAA